MKSSFGSRIEVKTQRPIAAEEEHQVLQFRPRNALRSPALQGNPAAQPPREVATIGLKTEVKPEVKPASLDLSRYERPREEPDDFRQRMLANVAAFAFTVALTAIGIWLAMSIADLRRTQDCVLMGRHDCVRISTP